MSLLDKWFGGGRANPSVSTRESSQLREADTRFSRDKATVAKKLPPGTAHEDIDGTTYWTYRFKCQMDRDYVMTAYFDGHEYQVKVLVPVLKKKYSVHDAHVFSDGRICLNPPANGAPSLEEAYSKSVIWASGFTIFEQIGKFPFSSNNG